jgi:uncharacterized FlgJ-related protein
MVYRYDSNQLVFRKNSKIIYIALAVLLVTFIISFTAGRSIRLSDLTDYEKELIVLNVKNEQNKFTEEKFVSLIKELNIKFPHIVMAQALLETGNFKSKVFLQNHNCFGMKQARIRVNTAKGTSLNHAYYDTWMESLYDYAFYQCRYMSQVNTEEQYYAALDASYAEASQYSQTLKGIVKKRNLKKLFK